MIYGLEPRYSSRKSFYGKAVVQEMTIDDEEIINLFSYNTLVAKIVKTKNKIVYNYLGHYSSTTTSHQKEFFKQNGLSDNQIKELIKKGSLEVIKNAEN